MGHFRYSGRNDLAVGYRFSNTGLRADNGTIPDGQVPGNAGLSCQNGVFTDGHAAGDANLGNQDGVLADDDIVGDMY